MPRWPSLVNAYSPSSLVIWKLFAWYVPTHLPLIQFLTGCLASEQLPCKANIIVIAPHQLIYL
jgi:hypothetical protein